MPHPHQTSNFLYRQRKQHGAALMVMLVIMVMGTAAFLVSSLTSSALKNLQQNKTAAALAQAKEALISRAVLDTSSPGSLPCPDITGGGSAEGATDCSFYIGRLPWKTLGLPDLRDSNGEPLWYALSRNFRKDSTNNHIDSDTVGDLTISGSPSANQIIAIVFAPGANIAGQSRSSGQAASCVTTGTSVAENLCAANYLESTNANLNTKTNLNKLFAAGDASATFNDQLIYITRDNLLPAVERRIAREAKQCLDDYAAQPSLTTPSQAHGKYPWAVPLTDTTNYLAVSNTLFGRIPTQPTINLPLTTTDPNIIAMLNALAALQTAVNNCVAADNSANRNALDALGNTLEDAAKAVRDNQPTVPPISAAVTTPAIAAGDKAQDSGRCGNINSNPTTNVVTTNLNTTNSALNSLSVPEDASMPTSWPATCTPLPSSSYWNSWRNFVFFRVSDAFRPNGTKNCGASCLSILGNGNSSQGSGSYRAAVIIAGKNLKTTARVPTNIQDYLEGVNSAVPSTTTLETYKAEDQPSKGVNDLVLCSDGKGLDPNSKCN